MSKSSFSIKKVLFLIIMGSMLVLSACGTGDKNNSSTNGDNSDSAGDSPKKVLNGGTEATFAPFEFMDKGELTGFDIELIQLLAEEAGYEVKMDNTGWDAMLAGLDSKNLDLGVSGITINEDRLKSYDFSNPYYASEGFLIVFKENLDIKNADDLKDKKIGVQNGTTGQMAVESVIGENAPNISKYESSALTFQALQSGTVEVVVTDKPVALDFLEKNPDSGLKSTEDKDAFQPEYYGIAFPKGSELKAEFDKALTTIFDNGSYEELYKKWFEEEPNIDSLKEAANLYN